jgi:hypothetical protein
MPFLIQVDVEADPIDFVCTAFGLEILSEQEDGYLLVASRDVDLAELESAIVKFESHATRGGSAAKLHGIFGASSRLARVLSEELSAIWPALDASTEYIVDLSVECLGPARPPSEPEQTEKDTPDSWARKQARYEAKWFQVYQRWDETRDRRTHELRGLISHYRGQILGIVDEVGEHRLQDSFSVRVQICGDGLRDVVQSYAFIFEASLPDDVQQPANSGGASVATHRTQLQGPAPDAPRVCVIDSGLQEGHVLLRDAVDTEASMSFLPGDASVGDQVSPNGHGTRVASAVLYPNGIPQGGYALPCWIQNARVLDASNQLPRNSYPPRVLQQVVEQYHGQGTSLFVHAVNAVNASRPHYMSAWAATLDQLCADRDVLVLQAAGNLPISGIGANPGVTEHLARGRPYPKYFDEASTRVANPGQSLHAVTVGSIGAAHAQFDTWRTLAGLNQVSAFSRGGPGIWNTIKPEIVEYGGDFGVDESTPVRVGMPPGLRSAYPELVRSTLHGGPAYDRDECGTSFAAPKAAFIAAEIAKELPEQSALLHRALLINSARWPKEVHTRDPTEMLATIRRIGFGLPDLERATRSTPTRVTLFTAGEQRVTARQAHVYQVRVPDSLRSVAATYPVLVEVTMAYAARPRRTRRGHRHYLSTWVDWKTSKQGEPATAFLGRVLKDTEAAEGDVGAVFDWMLSDRGDTGQVPGVRRNVGTVQKDWAFVSGDDLPRDFCLAVIGHPGWDTHVAANARYSLCVTFEILQGDLDLHADVEVALEELRAEIGSLPIEIPSLE